MRDLTIEMKSLESLEAFSRLRVIDGGPMSNGGNFHITGHGKGLLRSLDGLNLETVGYLIIEDNEKLGDIEALGSLETVEGAIKIANNPNLRTLDGLQGLDEIPYEGDTRGVDLRGNGLTDLSGLNDFTMNGGQVTLVNENKLETTETIGPRGTIALLVIRDNAKLRDLEWFSGIEKVTNQLHITGNRKLSACVVDEFVQRVEPEDGFRSHPLVYNNGPADPEGCD